MPCGEGVANRGRSTGFRLQKKAGGICIPPASFESWLDYLGYLPVPESATLCGLPGALSVKFSEPVRVPTWVGVKLTLTMQLLPAASVLPHFSFEVNENNAKSPVVEMFVMFSVEAPVLVTVTFFAPAVLPTTTLPHVSEVGFRETIGPLLVIVS